MHVFHPSPPGHTCLGAAPQVKDKWGFQLTARYERYAQLLGEYVRHDFAPQIVRDPSLPRPST